MKLIKTFFTFAALSLGIYGLALFTLGFAVSRYFHSLGQQQVKVVETMVEIPYGSSLLKVSSLLKDAHVIDDQQNFYWYVRLGRADGSKFQAGYYSFAGDLTASSVASRLLTGRDQSYLLTFKEGQTLLDLANGLEALGLVTKEQFIAAMRSPEVLRLIDAPHAAQRTALFNDMGGIEGYLFPDTYFFSKNDTAETIIKKMYLRLIAVLDQTILTKLAESKKTLHEVLTLASIIEKETGDPKERPIIASVYQNRIDLGMRLQADPTVIYGIKNYEGKIKKADLLTYHAYNTYKITGLPPGPIAAPGLHAIRAALWPEKTNYLYFVSKNDGSHIFCDNLTCHNNAVKKWQIDYFKNAAR